MHAIMSCFSGRFVGDDAATLQYFFFFGLSVIKDF